MAATQRDVAELKLASAGYEITEWLVAGIKLTGPEVKSAKQGHLSLRGAFATVRTEGTSADVWLRSCHISPYQPAAGAQRGYDPTHDRKLLLHRAEVAHLIGVIKARGLTVLPLRVFIERSLVKVELGVVRQRTKADRREQLRRRDAERQIRSHVRG
jgi:SsrA-binding protein